MGAASSLPEEVWTTKVSGYLKKNKERGSTNEHGGPWTTPPKTTFKTEEFYSVRATCKLAVHLAQRSLIASRNIGDAEWFHAAGSKTPRHVEAMGRVFGAGCNSLSGWKGSPERIAALETFVRCTVGGLKELELGCVPVPIDMLLRMCHASPKLVRLEAPYNEPTPYSVISDIAVACPELADVKFSNLGRDLGEYSPAETWAGLFPRLRCLSVCGRSGSYQPTRLDAIRQTALVTNAVELDVNECHITSDVIDAIAGTPFGDRIKALGICDHHDESIEGSIDASLEPDAMLAAARGFPNLEKLYIPDDSNYDGEFGPQFYADFGRAATRLRSLRIASSGTDACIAAACAHARLEYLQLENLQLTSGLVNAILAGQAAATLEELYIDNCAEESLRAGDMLRLVTGCPRLKDLRWLIQVGTNETPDRDAVIADLGTCRAIEQLLKSRGGTPMLVPASRYAIFAGPNMFHDWLPGNDFLW